MIFPGDYMLWYPASEGFANDCDRNLAIAKRAVELGRWPRLRIFASPMTACHVITHLDVSAVNNPHVTEWSDTFREIAEGDLPKTYEQWFSNRVTSGHPST
jgi:hypothetical protein